MSFVHGTMLGGCVTRGFGLRWAVIDARVAGNWSGLNVKKGVVMSFGEKRRMDDNKAGNFDGLMKV